MNAVEKYQRRVDRVDSLLCVGLDSALERIPAAFRSERFPQYAFNRYVIEQTHASVSAYKPNVAFYEACGAAGMHELELTIAYLREQHPDVLTILHAKRGDNSTTNDAYARAIFDTLGFDAVTLQPYMGSAVLRPFLDRADKGCIVLCRTSNPGDHELQELQVHDPVRGASVPLWQLVAERVRREWNTQRNCMLVIGATQPEILAQVRKLGIELTVLAPGIGGQGGDLKRAVQAGVNRDRCGLILSASRSVLFNSDPAAEARRLRDAINDARASL